VVTIYCQDNFYSILFYYTSFYGISKYTLTAAEPDPLNKKGRRNLLTLRINDNNSATKSAVWY